MTISIPVFLAAVFIVGFISSFIGTYTGDKLFGSEDIVLNMTIHTDSGNIDSQKIAEEMAEELKKIGKYIE